MLSASLTGLLALLVSVSAVSRQEVLLAKDACRLALRHNKDYIAGFIKLVVHDCAGRNGCDGCININQRQNAGLDKYIQVLRKLYNERGIYEYMSRADFWAVCAVEAVQVGYEKSNVQDIPPAISLSFRRENCHPDNPYTNEMENMPRPNRGLSETLQYYSEVYGLNKKQTVALLGMRSVGRERPYETGFEGSRTPNRFSLSNQYYVDLLAQERLDWTQVNKRTDEDPRWQWVHQRNERGLMLNSDISLVYDIHVQQNGRVEESLEQVDESETAPIVREFSNDNEQWLAVFGKAFEAVIQNYEELNTNYLEHGDNGYSRSSGGKNGHKTAGNGGDSRLPEESDNVQSREVKDSEKSSSSTASTSTSTVPPTVKPNHPPPGSAKVPPPPGSAKVPPPPPPSGSVNVPPPRSVYVPPPPGSVYVPPPGSDNVPPPGSDNVPPPGSVISRGIPGNPPSNYPNPNVAIPLPPPNHSGVPEAPPPPPNSIYEEAYKQAQQSRITARQEEEEEIVRELLQRALEDTY